MQRRAFCEAMDALERRIRRYVAALPIVKLDRKTIEQRPNENGGRTATAG
jgi:hypothetical protein